MTASGCFYVDSHLHGAMLSAMPRFTFCASKLEALVVSRTGASLQSFHSRTGRAYLFSAVVNLVSAEKEARLMTTGLHTVCDLYCNGCMQVVGWSYVSIMLVPCCAACLLLCPIPGCMP